MTDRFKLQDDEGRELDAMILCDIESESLCLVMESRGGSKLKNPRNPEYGEALELLLKRLRGLNARLLDARVDSSTTQGLSAEVCRIHLDQPFPLLLSSVSDVGGLRRELTGAGMRAAGRQRSNGEAPKGAGAWKRLRLVVDVPGFAPNDRLALRGALVHAQPGLSAYRAAVESEPEGAIPDLIPPGLDEPDGRRETPYRKEQSFLRDNLFRTGDIQNCELCGRVFHRRFLVAAHIKPRAQCTKEEKLDFRNIVMRACVFGCDALFEHGDLFVDPSGRVRAANPQELNRHAPDLAEDLSPHLNRPAPGFTPARAAYFAWHRLNRARVPLRLLV